MPKTSKKINLLLLITIAVTIIATALRFTAMYLNFDFETKFFINKALVTFLYAFVLIAVVVIFKASKDVAVSDTNPKDTLSIILNIFSLIIFALIFFIKLKEGTTEVLLEKVTWYVSVVSCLASVCYFASSRINSSFVKVLNLSPVIFLIAELVQTFVSVSSKANSYYLFPNIISLLALAFYILNDGKNKVSDISDDPVPICSFSLITFILLFFSAVPDAVMMITDGFELTKTYVLITVLKLIYLVSTMKTVVNIKINEDKK